MNRPLLTIVCWLALCCSAFAHKPSDSYLRITDGPQGISARWEISLKDLELLVGLDDNNDGSITWGEVKDNQKEIATHALSCLELTGNGVACDIRCAELLISRHSDGCYASLQLAIEGLQQASELEVFYSLLFDADPTHRGLVFFENADNASTHVIGPESPTLVIRTNESNRWQTLLSFVREGVWHIWIGFDHILFLLSLLMPAVLIRQDNIWQPSESFEPVWRNVLKIVTVFTLAHSITLWLSVMEYMTLPGWFVETTIAVSIIVTAYNNLHPVLPLSNTAVAFGFGLIHGFGFANVLLDLGLSNTTLAISLFGFNVGVELGQLAIVAAFLPIAYMLRMTALYLRVVVQFGSVLVAIVAGVWVYERLFNAEILGF